MMTRWSKNPLLELDRWLQVEAVLLFFATPFLLFPDVVRSISLLFAGGLIAIWLAQRAVIQRPLFRYEVWRLFVGLLVVGALIGIFVSADLDLTWSKAAGLLLGLGYLRFFCTAIKSRRALMWAVGWFLLIGAGMTALGLLTADWSLEKVPIMQVIVRRLPSLGDVLPGGRSGGTHTNQIGGTLLLYLPLLVAGVFYGRRRLDNKRTVWLLAAATALGLGFLVLTQSRSAWIGMLVAFLALFLIEVWLAPRGIQRTRTLLVLLGTLGLLLVVIGLLGSNGTIARLWAEPPRQTAVGPLDTVKFRQEVWQWGQVAAREYTFTGTGLGTFRRVIHRLYPVNLPYSYDIAHAHNVPLQVILDVGVLGLVGYVGLLGLACGACWQVMRYSSEWRPLAVGCLLCIIAFHVYGITDTIALGAKPGILWWMLLGLIISMNQLYLEG